MTYPPCILTHGPLAFKLAALPFKQSKPHPAFQTVDLGVMEYIHLEKNKGIRGHVKISNFLQRQQKNVNC